MAAPSSSGNVTTGSSSNLRTIFRVPTNIRKYHETVYTPRVVSIGPFHYDVNQKKLEAMQQYKSSCVNYLINRRAFDSQISRHEPHLQERANSLLGETCKEKMEDLVENAKKCYFGRISSSNEEFAGIMLLDGCFILHLILKEHLRNNDKNILSLKTIIEPEGWQERECRLIVDEGEAMREQNGWPEEEGTLLFGTDWIWRQVLYDLLLLENQMPFFVVMNLFELLRTSPKDDGVDLVKLALQLFDPLHPKRNKCYSTFPHGEIHHLLHLYHKSLLPSPLLTVPSSSSAVVSDPLLKQQVKWIHKATELEEAGLQFKSEDADSFLDVRFKDGVMVIPQLHYYSYSSTIFRNLVMLEQFVSEGLHVTSYAFLMKCLLSTGKDVRLLHLKDVILNLARTDDEVSEFFNHMFSKMDCAYDRNYYDELYTELREYYEMRWHRWQAIVKRNWIDFSVLVGFLIFLLTVVQAFFALLSYFRPTN